MKPVTFRRVEVLPMPARSIAEGLLDLARWPEFQGYGPLPGIRAAEFETRPPEVAGTRIQVTESNGGTHVETIAEWDPERRVLVRMDTFVPPLSRLATHIDETWLFERIDDVQTRVTRELAMYPRSRLTRPVLALISGLLKRAIDRHLRQMKEEAAKNPAARA